MYGRSARFYDSLYRDGSLRDARAEARRVVAEVQAHDPEARTLLDVACGTGRYLPFLAPYYAITGIDLNPELLAVARERVPEARFDVADMTNLDLGQRFDVIICLFSSIAYAKTVERMRVAIERMGAHLAPGGIVIVEPWFTPESFRDGHLVLNQVDDPDLKIAWMYRQERHGRLSILPIEYLVGTPDGTEHFTEQHEMGLFTHEEYSGAMGSIGLEVTFDPEAFGRGMYVGVAPR
jgi:SAM-dependent methyltransferase